MRKSKAWIWIPVIALILAGSIAAGVFLMPKKPAEPVYVYSMQDYTAGTYGNFSYNESSWGMVTADRVQPIFLSATQTVTEIMVSDGDEVHKGDVLFTYDTTLSALALERAELNVKQMKANLAAAKKDLAAYKKYRPITYIPAPTTKPTEPPVEPTPGKIEDGVNYRAFYGTGSKTAPVYCWLRSDKMMDKEVIDYVLSYAKVNVRTGVYVVFEHTENDDGEAEVTDTCGILLKETEVIDLNPTEPTDPSEEPTDPSEEPTDPSEEPTDPSEEPTDPSEEPTDPSEEPTDPSEDPTDPSEDPTDPSEEPTDPSEDPIDPSEDPTDPPEDPSEPGEEGLTAVDIRVYADEKENGDKDEDPVLTTKKVLKITFVNVDELGKPTVHVEPVGPTVDWGDGVTAEEKAQLIKDKEAEIKTLEFDIRMAEAEFKIMKREADDGKVLAQFDGVVAGVLDPQYAFEMNEPLMKISGGGGFYVEGSVSELKLDTIQIGQQVEVSCWMTGEFCIGTITEIGDYPSEDYYGNNETYYPYKVFIDESANLADGYYVDMTLQSGNVGSEKLYINNAFVLTDGAVSYVYVRNSEGLLERRDITLGAYMEWDSSFTEVRSGLTPEDYIAFPYGREVKEGAPTAQGDYSTLYGY